MSDVKERTVIVTGASRGFGRAIAEAFASSGARVVGVARTVPETVAGGEAITWVAADATEEKVAAQLIEEYRPTVLVLNAGAVPPLGPLHTLAWEDFARNWETDTRHAFAWTRRALTVPLAPGSTVVTMSSGAALRGSPASGGYAGAKAAIRFLTAYAADESARAGLGIRFATLLPTLTPETDLGRAGVGAYAARASVDPRDLIASMGAVLTPARVAAAVLEVVTGAAAAAEYMVTHEGLRPLP